MPSWLGGWEIVLILAIVLIIFGPKKLPELGASLGKSIRGFRKGLKEGKDEVQSTVNEVREAVGADEIKSAVGEMRQAAGVDELKSAVAEVREAVDLKKVLKSDHAATPSASGGSAETEPVVTGSSTSEKAAPTDKTDTVI